MDQTPLRGISKGTKNKELLKKSRQRFSSQITSDLLIAFCSKEDGLTNREMSVCLTLARLLTRSTFLQPGYISNSVVSRELGFFSQEKRI